MDLTLNPTLQVRTLDVPGTQEQVFVIDDFLLDPEPVLQFARNHAYFNPVGADGTFYPGIRDHMPAPYTRVLEQLLNQGSHPFTCGQGPQRVTKSMVSLITQQASQLHDVQKMPHIDSSNDRAYASVHYLSAEPRGGTAIYKYRPTGTVQINQQNQEVVLAMMEQVKAQSQEHSGYINGDTSLFEKLVDIPERFNRLVIYKSNLLHSARLTHDKSISSSPDEGRLTVSSFFNDLQ